MAVKIVLSEKGLQRKYFSALDAGPSTDTHLPSGHGTTYRSSECSLVGLGLVSARKTRTREMLQSLVEAQEWIQTADDTDNHEIHSHKHAHKHAQAR